MLCYTLPHSVALGTLSIKPSRTLIPILRLVLRFSVLQVLPQHALANTHRHSETYVAHCCTQPLGAVETICQVFSAWRNYNYRSDLKWPKVD
jgi:hypothetical protein